MSALPHDELAARMEALRERAEADLPQSWRPSGDEGHPLVLVGVMESREPGPDLGYGPQDIVVLRTLEDERWSVWLFHQVLRDEFDRKKPRVGDLVAVKYEGHVDGKTPASSGFEKYRLEVDRQETRADFAAIAEPARAPEPQVTPAASACIECGYTEPEHADGCPNGDDSIPF